MNPWEITILVSNEIVPSSCMPEVPISQSSSLYQTEGSQEQFKLFKFSSLLELRHHIQLNLLIHFIGIVFTLKAVSIIFWAQ